MAESIKRYEWEAELAHFAETTRKLKFVNLSTEQLDFIRHGIKLGIIPAQLTQLFNKKFNVKVPDTTFFDWYRHLEGRR